MTGGDYYQQIAAMRQQRHVREATERVRELAEEHANAVRERDEALRGGDIETADFYDNEAERAEAEYSRLAGPQIPKQTMEWLQKNQDFFQRYGGNAAKAVMLAHQFATAPRDPSTTANRQSGMGLTANTPEYFTAIENLLEMYGKDQRVGGVTYNRNDVLTPEVARDIASEKLPLSTNEYNEAVQEMHRSGKNSDALHGAQWKRSAG